VKWDFYRSGKDWSFQEKGVILEQEKKKTEIEVLKRKERAF
jgi:hypothetical protein